MLQIKTEALMGCGCKEKVSKMEQTCVINKDYDNSRQVRLLFRDGDVVVRRTCRDGDIREEPISAARGKRRYVDGQQAEIGGGRAASLIRVSANVDHVLRAHGSPKP
jgi:hypothetical protein